MGSDVNVRIILVNATKDFPFLRAVLEKNAEKDMVFGMECYVYENYNGESLYDWDYDVGIPELDIRKEIERQKVQMEKEYVWEDEFDDLQREYIEFMATHDCYGYSHCVEL